MCIRDRNHVIDNVFVYSLLHFNLLSVTKLVDRLSCVLTFYSNGCHIQDKNSLKIIGYAKMQDILYILRIPSYQKFQIKPLESTHIINTVNVSASDLETLWHFRLFQINVLKLSRINFLLLNITNLLFVMFVILQSKKDFLFLLVHLNRKMFWFDSCRYLGIILNTINSWS